MTRYHAVMIKLVQPFIWLCLFRASTSDVPASRLVFYCSLLFYFIAGTFVSHIDNSWRVSIVASISDTLMLLFVAWGLLNIKNFPSRFLQTAASLAGTGGLISLISLPIFMLLRAVDPQQGQLTSVVLLLVIVAIFWSLFVTAHIFRYALEISPAMSAVYTVAYTMMTLVVVGLSISGVV